MNWKAVVQDGRYEVSDTGEVRRIGGRVMKPWRASRTGYVQVQLAGKKKFSLHRLVAMAFCPGYAPGLVVNHKNGIRTDNRAENLEWVTQAENAAHAFRELGRIQPATGRFGKDHNTSKPVVSTNLRTRKETRYESGMDAVRDGFSSAAISRCCAGKAGTHKGHLWRFGAAREVVWSEPVA